MAVSLDLRDLLQDNSATFILDAMVWRQCLQTEHAWPLKYQQSTVAGLAALPWGHTSSSCRALPFIILAVSLYRPHFFSGMQACADDEAVDGQALAAAWHQKLAVILVYGNCMAANKASALAHQINEQAAVPTSDGRSGWRGTFTAHIGAGHAARDCPEQQYCQVDVSQDDNISSRWASPIVLIA